MKNAAKEGLKLFEKVAGSKSVYGAWLRKGQVCHVKPLSEEEKAYVDKVVSACGGFRFFKTRQCYMNAQTLLMRDLERRFEYWEGWYADTTKAILAFHHAWLTINGKVVDMTVEALHRKYPEREPKDYFGVPIPRNDVMKNMVATEHYAGLTEMPRHAAKFLDHK